MFTRAVTKEEIMRHSQIIQVFVLAVLGGLAQSAQAFEVLSNIDGSNNGSSCGTDMAVSFTTALL